MSFSLLRVRQRFCLPPTGHPRLSIHSLVNMDANEIFHKHSKKSLVPSQKFITFLNRKEIEGERKSRERKAELMSQDFHRRFTGS